MRSYTVLDRLNDEEIDQVLIAEAADDAVVLNPKAYSLAEAVRRLLATWRLNRRLLDKHGIEPGPVSINRVNGAINREDRLSLSRAGVLGPGALDSLEPIEARIRCAERNPAWFSAEELDQLTLARLRTWHALEKLLDIDPAGGMLSIHCSTGFWYLSEED